jgi:hypothetical protein
MNKLVYILLIASIGISSSAFSQSNFKIFTPIDKSLKIKMVTWNVTEELFSPWLDLGEIYADSGYSEPLGSQITEFIQNRTFSQDKTRTRTERKLGTNGAIEITGTFTENDTETQTVIRTVSVNSNSVLISTSDCLDWTPLKSTISLGVNFVQSRDCTKNYETTYVFSIDGSEAGHSHSVLTSPIVNETQDVIGNRVSWSVMEELLSPWINSGDIYNDSGYLEAQNTQTTNFSQNRTYSQNKIRTRTERELGTNGEIQITGTFTENDTETPTVTRTVSINSNTVLLGSPDCLDWTPLKSTVNSGVSFVQSRDCTENYRTTYVFSIENVETGHSHSVLTSAVNTVTRNRNGNRVARECLYKYSSPSSFAINIWGTNH